MSDDSDESEESDEESEEEDTKKKEQQVAEESEASRYQKIIRLKKDKLCEGNLLLLIYCLLFRASLVSQS